MSQDLAAQNLSAVEESSMSLMEHLMELRTRLMWVVGGLLIGTIISMSFASPIIKFITEPLTQTGAIPRAISPTETIIIFFKVSFTFGAAIAMPVIVYQIIGFIAPGLYPHEKRWLLILLPGIMLLFVGGAAFAYFVMLPVAVAFLQNFLSDVILQEWTIERYVSLITRIVFWIGIAFETPLVVSFLARIGLLSGPQLLNVWRQAIVVLAIVAAIITPTIDPVNMAIVMIPLLGLYFASVGLAYILFKPRDPRDFGQEPFSPPDEL